MTSCGAVPRILYSHYFPKVEIVDPVPDDRKTSFRRGLKVGEAEDPMSWADCYKGGAGAVFLGWPGP